MIRVPAEAAKNINAVADGRFNQASFLTKSKAFLCPGMKRKERYTSPLDEMTRTSASSMRFGNRSQKNEAAIRRPVGRTDASLTFEELGKGRVWDRPPDSPYGCYFLDLAATSLAHLTLDSVGTPR
jgi:hypothetical protein